MTFTLDFQGQILKKSYLRNGMADWHGTKGMWVDWMLHLLCDFQCPPTSSMTLILDFQGQILKMLYLRNGRADWHGTKAMWIDRMLHPLRDFQHSPHPWPWPWIFEVKFWKSHISGMGWPIDMELKGCELIECWTHAVTFNVHFTHDLDLGFSRSNFENAVSQEWEGRLTWNERDLSEQNVGPMLWLSVFTSSITKFWKSRISGLGWLIDIERKGCESIEC